jgi:hypothetical protein
LTHLSGQKRACKSANRAWHRTKHQCCP